MNRQWILKQVNPDCVAKLASAAGLSAVVSKVMVARELDEPAIAARFLSPRLSDMADPFLMSDMEQAVSRLVHARNNGEKVCVYGDYDVDGISSVALLVSGFSAMGIESGYHIPNRMEDGYGLNCDALSLIAGQGYRLAVTVDCGATSIAEAAFCKNRGLDLIITDHHQLLPELPDAVAVINPHRTDCSYPFKKLAGAGVAFNLLAALRKRLREQGAFSGNEPDLREFLDLVALGTIADLVPLVGQNRILATAGLKRMSFNGRTGIEALKQVAGIKGNISSGHVGFQIAPRLNAAGRLESAVPGVELLLSDDPSRALSLAEELDAANIERRQMEKKMVEEAVAMVELSGNKESRRSIVLASPEWHQGVVGIVASRMVERYYLPTLLISQLDDGTGKGSGRSISGFHLLDAIDKCAEHLQRYGGHRVAAGVTVKPGQIEPFISDFEKVAASLIGDNAPVPQLLIDAELDPHELDMQTARELQKLEPFGMGNQTPVFLISGVQVVSCRVFGVDNLELRLKYNDVDYRAVGWGMADYDVPSKIDIVCALKIDIWNRQERLQLEIRDLRSSATASP